MDFVMHFINIMFCYFVVGLCNCKNYAIVRRKLTWKKGEWKKLIGWCEYHGKVHIDQIQSEKHFRYQFQQ